MFQATWFPALMVFLAVVFGTLTIALGWEAAQDWWRRRKAGKQLRRIMGEPDHETALQLVRNREGQRRSNVRGLFRFIPGAGEVRELMRQARLNWSVGFYLLLTLGLAAGLGAAAYLLSRWILLTVAVTAVGAWLPYLYANRRRRRFGEAFEEQLPEAIELLTRAIRAGHPLSSGLRMVAEEGPPVVAEEFRQTFEEQRFGLPFNDALMGMVDRVDLVDVRIFVIAVLVQREVGGNLAEILENLAHTIRGRFYIRRQLRVYTAQGRMTGWILALLPPLVVMAAFLIQPDYIMTLFTNFFGVFLVIIAVFLQVIGVLWIRKIVNIEI
jgi:tight adherence protein B